jgi:hypothetical protein
MQFVCVASPVSTQHYVERANTGLLGIRIICPSGATCCFSEHENPTKRVGLVQSGPDHHHHHMENELVLAMM